MSQPDQDVTAFIEKWTRTSDPYVYNEGPDDHRRDMTADLTALLALRDAPVREWQQRALYLLAGSTDGESNVTIEEINEFVCANAAIRKGGA